MNKIKCEMAVVLYDLHCIIYWFFDSMELSLKFIFLN